MSPALVGKFFTTSSTWDFLGAYLVAQSVNKLPAMQETWVQSLGQEDPLEKGMTTHSSILAWRSPWTEVPDGLQSMGWQRVRHGWAHNTRHLNHGPFSSQKTAWTTAVSGKFQGKDNSLFCICNKFFVSKKRIIYFMNRNVSFSTSLNHSETLFLKYQVEGIPYY